MPQTEAERQAKCRAKKKMEAKAKAEKEAAEATKIKAEYKKRKAKLQNRIRNGNVVLQEFGISPAKTSGELDTKMAEAERRRAANAALGQYRGGGGVGENNNNSSDDQTSNNSSSNYASYDQPPGVETPARRSAFSSRSNTPMSHQRSSSFSLQRSTPSRLFPAAAAGLTLQEQGVIGAQLRGSMTPQQKSLSDDYFRNRVQPLLQSTQNRNNEAARTASEANNEAARTASEANNEAARDAEDANNHAMGIGMQASLEFDNALLIAPPGQVYSRSDELLQDVAEDDELELYEDSDGSASSMSSGPCRNKRSSSGSQPMDQRKPSAVKKPRVDATNPTVLSNPSTVVPFASTASGTDPVDLSNPSTAPFASAASGTDPADLLNPSTASSVNLSGTEPFVELTDTTAELSTSKENEADLSGTDTTPHTTVPARTYYYVLGQALIIAHKSPEGELLLIKKAGQTTNECGGWIP